MISVTVEFGGNGVTALGVAVVVPAKLGVTSMAPPEVVAGVSVAAEADSVFGTGVVVVAVGVCAGSTDCGDDCTGAVSVICSFEVADNTCDSDATGFTPDSATFGVDGSDSVCGAVKDDDRPSVGSGTGISAIPSVANGLVWMAVSIDEVGEAVSGLELDSGCVQPNALRSAPDTWTPSAADDMTSSVGAAVSVA